MTHDSAGLRRRALQVGLGFWGMNWVTEVLPRVPELEVVAWADQDPARLQALDDTIHVGKEALFESMEEALTTLDVEAVLITARIESHFALAREALLAGKHVLLEKPFTVRFDEAEELVRLAAERDLALVVAQNYRYWPVAVDAARLVAEGAIGTPINARVSFRRDHRDYPPAVAAPIGSATGSILYQIAVHHFDLVRYILGDITDVDGRRWAKGNMPGRTLTAFSATLTLDSGLLVEYSGNQASLAPTTPWSGLWEIEGDAGSLRWAGDASADGLEAILELRRGDGAPQAVTIASQPYTDRQAVVHEFLHILDGGYHSGIEGRENLKTLRAVTDVADALRARDCEGENGEPAV